MASTYDMISADIAESTPASTPAAESTPAPISADTTAEIDGIPDDTPTEITDTQVPEVEIAPETPPEPEPSDDDKPQIENLTESRWKRVHGGYKMFREYAKALGVVQDDKSPIDMSLMPAVGEFQGMQQAYSDRLAMEHDFQSGDPQNIQQWIENWATGGDGASAEVRAAHQRGMQVMAASLPDYLATANTSAYMAMAQPVFKRALDHMLQSAPQIEDEGLRNYVLNARRAMQWWLAGGTAAPPNSYDTDEQIQQAMQRRPAAAPNQTEQELAYARQQLQQIHQQTSEAKWGQTKASVDAAVGQEYWSAVDKTLAPLKAHYSNETTFRALKNEYVGQIQKAMTADQFSARRYQLAAEQARRGQQGGVEAMKAAYVNWARKAMAQVAPTFVSEASKGIVAASGARHKALATGAAKVGPASGGAPRQQSIVGDLKRNPGESASEFSFRRIAADMAG